MRIKIFESARWTISGKYSLDTSSCPTSNDRASCTSSSTGTLGGNRNHCDYAGKGGRADSCPRDAVSGWCCGGVRDVCRCDHLSPSRRMWDVPVLKTTLSMTAPIDTYADHYNYVAAGTGSMVNLTSGQSRLEVTLAVEKSQVLLVPFRQSTPPRLEVRHQLGWLSLLT